MKKKLEGFFVNVYNYICISELIIINIISAFVSFYLCVSTLDGGGGLRSSLSMNIRVGEFIAVIVIVCWIILNL